MGVGVEVVIGGMDVDVGVGLAETEESLAGVSGDFGFALTLGVGVRTGTLGVRGSVTFVICFCHSK
ncbi:MAG: hypothetical protein EAZ28_12080 [Oscillatoriales cyanobacterium]|nr:MAG: hypothetical protein EAZ28_12080 [Oscillatoriales cyanobacterium]